SAVCFFFSSRRRHTRFSRDWSSDVCSSDLKRDNWAALTGGRSGIRSIKRFPVDHLATTIAGLVDFLSESEQGATALTLALAELRSEERRVGKECGSRWSPHDSMEGSAGRAT